MHGTDTPSGSASGDNAWWRNGARYVFAFTDEFSATQYFASDRQNMQDRMTPDCATARLLYSCAVVLERPEDGHLFDE